MTQKLIGRRDFGALALGTLGALRLGSGQADAFARPEAQTEWPEMI